MPALQGLMQDRPLMISSLIEHAARFHPHTEIVSRLPETRDGGLHRTDWAGMRRASCQVANALQSLGVQPGERVGTLAWNSWRHLALYFGVSGSGAVLHTVNPRLFPEQIVWIANDAKDRVLCFDLSFLPLVEKLAGSITREVLFTPPASLIRRSLTTVDQAVEGQVQTFIVTIDFICWCSHRVVQHSAIPMQPRRRSADLQWSERCHVYCDWMHLN